MENPNFETIFKNIDNKLYKDEGADSELDYVEQTSWIMFLRYLDELEERRELIAKAEHSTYKPIIDDKYRWSTWAVPKNSKGEVDINKAKTGPELINFVSLKLFPYLAKFKEKASSPKTIEYKIGEIFEGIKFRIGSGYVLRDILDYADKLKFDSNVNKHELSSLYENRLKNMGNAGRNGGQYYTPRPLIRAIIKIVNPNIGEKIYDGAAGSCGFLCESLEFLKNKMETNPSLKTTANKKTIYEDTLYGKEKKALGYIVGTMNMILHGIEAPNLVRMNTLSENINNISEKKRFDIILTNPPFGGKELVTVQNNFEIKSGETAFLFLQHYIKMLKKGGRAGIVIKNTFLSNTDNATISLRKYLLETCNLHTIIDLPQKTFQAGVHTIVLFFEKGTPTKDIWYYQLDPGRKLGKKHPLNDDDLEEFVSIQPERRITQKSWILDVSDIDTSTYDMSVINPNAPKKLPPRPPEVLIEEIGELFEETSDLLDYIKRRLV